MAPKIVDKDKKRLEILHKAYDFLIKEGIKKFSIDSLLKDLNMSKGNFYHYFESKDQLIHKMMEEFTKSYILYCDEKIKNSETLKNKLEVLFEMYLKDSKTNKDFLKLYNEFLITYSSNNQRKICQINNDYITYLSLSIKTAIKEEIEKGFIKEESIHFVSTLSATVDGMMMYSFILENYNLNKEVQDYLDNFILMIKKD